MGLFSSIGKFIGSAAGGNLLGAGASLVGSLFGKESSDNANEANIQIARETNALQERMFNQQLQWNLDQWNRNNAYNTPANQVKRFREAGLNPYLMMQGGAGVGQSSGPAAGANVPQLHTPQIQPYDPSSSFSAAGNMIGQISMQKAQVRNVDADTQGKLIDNMTKNAINLAKIREMNAHAKDLVSKSLLTGTQNRLAQATFNDSVTYAHLQNLFLDEQTQVQRQTRLNLELQNRIDSWNYKHLPQQFAAQVAQMWSQVEVNRSNAAYLAKAALESVARANNIDLQSGQLKELTPLLVQEKQSNIDLLNTDYVRRQKDLARDYDDHDMDAIPSYGRFLIRNFSPLKHLFGK